MAVIEYRRADNKLKTFHSNNQHLSENKINEQVETILGFILTRAQLASEREIKDTMETLSVPTDKYATELGDSRFSL